MLCTDVATCNACSPGYDLNTTCSLSFCMINYCASCLTMSTCSECISGFTLSSDNTTCTTNCSSIHANCLLCSGSTCTYCTSGYKVEGSSCSKACSVANCDTCLSTTQCGSCADGYLPSSDKTSCVMACKVDNCVTCASTSSTSCSACESGYSTKKRDGSTDFFCAKDCPLGYVNSASSGITCSKCSLAI